VRLQVPVQKRLTCVDSFRKLLNDSKTIKQIINVISNITQEAQSKMYKCGFTEWQRFTFPLHEPELARRFL